MIKKCKVCGKEFKTYPSKVKIGRGKYCSKECSLKITNSILEKNGEKTRFKEGENPHNYQGYTYTRARKNGRKYILMYIPNHPNASKKGYIRKHRYVMELKLGRLLNNEEVVHHINGDTENNNINNLQVMTIKEHNSIKEINAATYDSKY